jgi:hypothetical protein
MSNEVSIDEPNEVHGVIRKHNRVLRRTTHLLRVRVNKEKEHSDELFTALCQTNPRAEEALREIWESDVFGPQVDPEDYDQIVSTCLEALREYRGKVQDTKRV